MSPSPGPTECRVALAGEWRERSSSTPSLSFPSSLSPLLNNPADLSSPSMMSENVPDTFIQSPAKLRSHNPDQTTTTSVGGGTRAAFFFLSSLATRASSLSWAFWTDLIRFWRPVRRKGGRRGGWGGRGKGELSFEVELVRSGKLPRSLDQRDRAASPVAHLTGSQPLPDRAQRPLSELPPNQSLEEKRLNSRLLPFPLFPSSPTPFTKIASSFFFSLTKSSALSFSFFLSLFRR